MAFKAMKLGAYDYLPKPFTADEVILTLRKAEEREKLRREVTRLQNEFREDLNLRQNEELGKLQRSLLKQVQDYADKKDCDHDDCDCAHYIFEAAIEAFYGDKYWK